MLMMHEENVNYRRGVGGNIGQLWTIYSYQGLYSQLYADNPDGNVIIRELSG